MMARNEIMLSNSELYVLFQTDMASVLVEVGFIDGPSDAEKLAQSIIAEMKA